MWLVPPLWRSQSTRPYPEDSASFPPVTGKRSLIAFQAQRSHPSGRRVRTFPARNMLVSERTCHLVCQSSEALSLHLFAGSLGEELTPPSRSHEGINLMKEVFWNHHVRASIRSTHNVPYRVRYCVTYCSTIIEVVSRVDGMISSGPRFSHQSPIFLSYTGSESDEVRASGCTFW